MRVLLSDGSGLTARQVATQLDAAGHAVEVLSPDPLALTRFTRHVRQVHRVPPYGADPFSWFDAALAVYREGRFDVLLPTQEQVAVLSACLPRVLDAGISTAVPSFAALVAVQDKVSAHATLARLGLAQPDTKIVHSADELATCDLLPAYVKTPIGTATTGVRHVQDRAEATALATTWDATGVFRDGPALVQAPCDGPLVMIQTIFSEGGLVASHANVRLREGASGGASHKRGVDLAAVREDLGRLGADLRWRGALSADAILTDRGPVYIDINPRLVEPANAWQSGVDLVRALVDVARDRPQTPQAPGREGVATHQLLLAVLGAAQHRRTRRAVARELLDAALHRDTYRASVEELTPIRHDLRTLLPIAAASTATLIHPNAWRWFSAGAVSNYALTPDAWQTIRDKHL
jgi:hypothetical protein